MRFVASFTEERVGAVAVIGRTALLLAWNELFALAVLNLPLLWKVIWREIALFSIIPELIVIFLKANSINYRIKLIFGVNCQ